MATTIRINALDTASVNSAIAELQRFRSEQNQKVQDVCMRVADFGARWAGAEFASAEYDGTNDVRVTSEPTADGALVRASGEATLFIEYGSGALRGYGHPLPGSYGPGTYPGKGHWDDPNGWYYAHGQKSWGNPPAAAMYHAERAMRDYAPQIVNGETV